MIARRGETRFEEVIVRWRHQCGSGHKSAAGVPVHADSLHVDKGEPLSELLDGGFFVGQSVISQVEVTVRSIGLGTPRSSTAMTDLDHDKTDLGQLLLAGRGCERVPRAFLLGARVDISDDRVLFVGIEVERLVHVAEQVSHAVGCLDDKGLRHLPTHLLQPRQVALLQCHDLDAIAVADH